MAHLGDAPSHTVAANWRCYVIRSRECVATFAGKEREAWGTGTSYCS